MQESNPLFDIHPPHLDGFLVSKQGQFLLTPLTGGKTLLKGSTFRAPDLRKMYVRTLIAVSAENRVA